MPRYVRPDWFTSHVFNPLLVALTRLGISVLDSRILRVRGRSSGEWRSTPVNLMRYQGATYLVAPRGHTQWVRNLRAAGSGELQLGGRAEPFTAVELQDDEKPPLLREYLRRWAFESAAFFQGVKAGAPDTELRRIAADHPIFKLDLRR